MDKIDLTDSGIEEATSLRNVSFIDCINPPRGFARNKELRGANVSELDLTLIGIEGAKDLRGVIFGGNNPPEGLAKDKDLSSASLDGLDLTQIKIGSAKIIRGINFKGSRNAPRGFAVGRDLASAHLEDLDLAHIGIGGAINLMDVDFFGSKLSIDTVFDNFHLWKVKDPTIPLIWYRGTQLSFNQFKELQNRLRTISKIAGEMELSEAVDLLIGKHTLQGFLQMPLLQIEADLMSLNLKKRVPISAEANNFTKLYILNKKNREAKIDYDAAKSPQQRQQLHNEWARKEEDLLSFAKTNFHLSFRFTDTDVMREKQMIGEVQTLFFFQNPQIYPKKGRPIVIYAHGDGAKNKMKRKRYDPLFFYLISKGYVVVAPNFRQGHEVEDLYAASVGAPEALKKMNVDVDPSLVFLSGISAGSNLIFNMLTKIEEEERFNPFKAVQLFSTCAGVPHQPFSRRLSLRQSLITRDQSTIRWKPRYSRHVIDSEPSIYFCL